MTESRLHLCSIKQDAYWITQNELLNFQITRWSASSHCRLSHTLYSHLFSSCFELEEVAPQVSAVRLCLMLSSSVRLKKNPHDKNWWECSSFRKLNFFSEIFKKNFSSPNVYSTCTSLRQRWQGHHQLPILSTSLTQLGHVCNINAYTLLTLIMHYMFKVQVAKQGQHCK